MLAGGDDYAEFKKRLVERFLPFNHRDLVRNELMSIKQYGSFDNFVKKFLSYINQLNDSLTSSPINTFLEMPTKQKTYLMSLIKRS